LKSTLIFGGDNETLNLIDMDSHKIIDLIPIGKIITCLDSIYSNDGQVITLIGCNNGDIFIRRNFEILNKKINFCRFKTITCIKFCQDYNSFVLTNSEGVIYFIVNERYSNNNFKKKKGKNKYFTIESNDKSINKSRKSDITKKFSSNTISKKSINQKSKKSQNTENKITKEYYNLNESNNNMTKNMHTFNKENSQENNKENENSDYQEKENSDNQEDFEHSSGGENSSNDDNSSSEVLYNEENQEEDVYFDYKINKNFILEKGNGYPISVTFDNEFSKVLLLTNKSKIILINLKTFQIINTLEDISSTFWNNFEGYYINNSVYYKDNNHINFYHTTTQMENLEAFNDYNNRITFALGNKFNFFITSDFNNNFFIYKDYSNISKNKNFIFNVHNSHIQNIKIRSDDKIFVTFGYSDRMICEWALNQTSNENFSLNYNEDNKKNMFGLNDVNNFKNSNYINNVRININTINNDIEKKIFYYKNFNNSNKEVKICDMNLINELSYCFCSNEISYENDVNKLLTEEFSK